MGDLIEMKGRQFGRLTVMERAPREGDTRAYWACSCECGGKTTVSGKSLRNGVTQSCGCLRVEAATRMGASPEYSAANGLKNRKHGHKLQGSMTPEYSTWLHIKRRCYDKKARDYPRYGGAGIRVSKDWADSFETFLADMGPRPSPKHVLIRVETTRHYEAGNCQWAEASVAASRPRKAHIPVTIGGLDFPNLSAACRHFGVRLGTVVERVKAGIDLNDAVTRKAWEMKPRRTRESYLPHGHPDRS